MRAINHAIFLAEFERRFGHWSARVRASLNAFVSCLEADPRVAALEDAAYMTATCWHESGHTMEPVHERGGRLYFIKHYGPETRVGRSLGNRTDQEAVDYSGIGDVQLTGRLNFEWAEAMIRLQYPEAVKRFEARTGKSFDLTVGDQPGDEHDPENAADPEIAYCILSEGMRTGRFGRPMGIYTHKHPPDFPGARHSVNGTDRAEAIAGFARSFLLCFEAAAKAVDAQDSPADARSPAAGDAEPGGAVAVAPGSVPLPAEPATPGPTQTIQVEAGGSAAIMSPAAPGAASVPIVKGASADTPSVEATRSLPMKIAGALGALWTILSGKVDQLFGMPPETQRVVLYIAGGAFLVWLLYEAIRQLSILWIRSRPDRFNVH